MFRLIKVFFRGTTLRTAILGLIGLLLLSGAEVYLSFRFLDWYKNFYDTLQNKDYIAFKKELVLFTGLAALSVIQYTILRFVNQTYTLKWREAITLDFLDRWKGGEVEGYAQRLQEDCAKFARLFDSIFMGCFSAVVSIVVFTPMLYTLSKVVFPQEPYLLLLICAGYATIGIALSLMLGRKLPLLEYDNQKEEARFRRALEFKTGDYFHLFSNVKNNYSLLYSRYKVFNFFSSAYFQLGVILPYLLIGQYYFTGLITLGAMVQMSKAFNKVNDNMSYLVDSWLSITEFQSVLKRLKEFNNSI